MILEQRPLIRRLLRGMGVPVVDHDDMVQEIVLGAWQAMTAGRFRPNPDRPVEVVLRAWLAGIAWRQVSHYRQRAHRRREVLFERIWDPEMEPEVHPEGRLEARSLVWIFLRLPRLHREVLGLVAVGVEFREIAQILGIPLGTVSSRVRLARAAFRKALR